MLEKSDELFKARRRFEANRLPGLDLNRLSGARIYTFTRLGFSDGECSKAWQRKAASLLQFLDNRFNEISRCLVGGNARNLSGVLYGFGNKSFRRLDIIQKIK